MKVAQVMTHAPAVCLATATLADAARVMWDADVGFLPVVDEHGAVICTVTDRDACMAAYTQGRPLSAIPVQLAMAKKVFSCREDEELEAVHDLLRRCHIRRLPVLDAAGRLVGVVSLGDLASRALDGPAGTARDAVALTLVQVSTPRSKQIPFAPPPRATRQAKSNRQRA